MLEGKKYSAKTDIWSLGLLVYEMLFGRTPWPCRDSESLLRNIKKKSLSFPYDK